MAKTVERCCASSVYAHLQLTDHIGI